MSRKRVVYAEDARGRPLSRWEDVPEEPRFGHMQPAFDAGPIERRQATAAELADREEQRQEHQAAIATEAGIAVLRSLPDNPRAHPWRLPVRAEEEPAVIEPVIVETIEDQVDAGPAQPGAVNPGYEPASTEPRPASAKARLDALAKAAWDAGKAADRLDSARAALDAAEDAWVDARLRLRAAWFDSLVSVVVEATPAPPSVSEAEVRHERLLEDVITENTRIEAARRQAEEDAAWLDRRREEGLPDLAAAAEPAPRWHDNVNGPDRVEMPAPEAGGGPGLPRQQQRILDATVELLGDRKAAAARLGISIENLNGALHKIGAKGLLPFDLIAQLPAGFAKYQGA